MFDAQEPEEELLGRCTGCRKILSCAVTPEGMCCRCWGQRCQAHRERPVRRASWRGRR